MAFNNKSNWQSKYNCQNKGNWQPQQQYKRSGATYSKIRKGDKEGLLHIAAWRLVKDGMITASCFPIKSKEGGYEIEGKNGKWYINYVIELKKSTDVNVVTHFGLLETSSSKLYIPKLNWIISKNGNGKTRSGANVSGYFGTLRKR